MPNHKSRTGDIKMQLPINALTGAEYSGQNIGLLTAQAAEKGFTSQQFAGFKQWLEKGRIVKKGEKAIHGLMVVTKKTENGEKKICRGFSVFALEQTTEMVQA